MREIVIKENEAGQRFDKYLKKYLPEAPGSFIYKMLRKKNIVLNEGKASGSEKLSAGDHVKLFLGEDTIGRFSAKPPVETEGKPSKARLAVIYEDHDILVLNKPAGMLSQKAGREDFSVVEAVTEYLLFNGSLTREELRTFRPGVCNRLDRNTSGIIVAGKSLSGLQVMSELFRTRELKKYYLCLVKGAVTEKKHIRGYLRKDERTNRVEILTDSSGGKEKAPAPGPGFVPVETEYEPVAYCQKLSLLKVHLITGRTHQIRAQLAFEDHPVLGDYKYGCDAFNDSYKKKYGVTAQLLHAYCLSLPDIDGKLAGLSGREFFAEVPKVFYRIIEDVRWQHGTQEALEVRH